MIRQQTAPVLDLPTIWPIRLLPPLLDCFCFSSIDTTQINLSPIEQIQYEELMEREMENKRILIIHLNKPARIKAEDLFSIILNELTNRGYVNEAILFRRAIIGFDHNIKIPSYTQIAFENNVVCRIVQIALSNILRKENMKIEDTHLTDFSRNVKAVLQSTHFTIRCTLKYLKSIMIEFNKISNQKMIIYMNTPVFFFRRPNQKRSTELSCYSSLIRSEVLKCTVRNDRNHQILWLFKRQGIPRASWLTIEMAIDLVSQFNNDQNSVFEI